MPTEVSSRSCFLRLLCSVLLLAALGGCVTQPVQAPRRSPAEVRAQLMHLLPTGAADRPGWAADITVAFAALDVDSSTQHLCAALAVAEQESNFTADPIVPGLGKIARAEIDRRAEQHDIPQLLVRAALSISSSNGKSYSDRIAAVHSERELSLIYEDLIDRVPLGQRLFADANPVHTGGPMQVSVSFAEQQAKQHPYPYPVDGSIRHEVFSRRGGVYFGIAHLLGFPVSYDRMIYRFADYNAGFYASRNAAFQNAVSLASGIALARDGDLISYDGDNPGKTELAVRTLSRHLQIDDSEIHRALAQGESPDFEKTALYRNLFAFAERTEHQTLPRAMLPRIDLVSPKITRKLSTEWFANRVEQRYRTCLAKEAGQNG